MTVTFETGKTYGDFGFLVTKRTAKTVTICGIWATAEPMTKKVSVKNDVEYVKTSSFCLRANDEYIDPETREKMRTEAIRQKKEEARLNRIAIRIPNVRKREVETIDQNVIIAWALGNNMKDLVEYAYRIETGSVMMCADTEQNHCTKELFFPCGVQVWIHDGVHDKYTTHFFANGFRGSRRSFDEKFKVECNYMPDSGETYTKDGVRMREDGTKWEPDYESMNY